MILYEMQRSLYTFIRAQRGLGGLGGSPLIIESCGRLVWRKRPLQQMNPGPQQYTGCPVPIVVHDGDQDDKIIAACPNRCDSDDKIHFTRVSRRLSTVQVMYLQEPQAAPYCDEINGDSKRCVSRVSPAAMSREAREARRGASGDNSRGRDRRLIGHLGIKRVGAQSGGAIRFLPSDCR